MPKQETTSTFTYSDKEIQDLIYRDLIDKRLVNGSSDTLESVNEIRKIIDSYPIGNFDEETIYGFGGLQIKIKRGS